MPDRLTAQQRHNNMAAIKAKDTKPELLVRKYLWAHGFRYRLNHHRLPGKPDVVLRKYHTCIFVNGCFWHGHNITPATPSTPDVGQYQPRFASSTCCKIPKTNTEFWENKISRNRERDAQVRQRLTHMGWNCITIWECELRPDRRQQTLQSLAFTLNHIYLQQFRRHTYTPQSDEQPAIAAEQSPE